MELKWKSGLSPESLDTLADQAWAQIEGKKYDTEMKEDGVADVLKFGIAFSGKMVCVKTSESGTVD